MRKYSRNISISSFFSHIDIFHRTKSDKFLNTNRTMRTYVTEWHLSDISLIYNLSFEYNQFQATDKTNLIYNEFGYSTVKIELSGLISCSGLVTFEHYFIYNQTDFHSMLDIFSDLNFILFYYSIKRILNFFQTLHSIREPTKCVSAVGDYSSFLWN